MTAQQRRGWQTQEKGFRLRGPSWASLVFGAVVGLLAVVVPVSLIGCATEESADAAPDFSLLSANGPNVSLSQLLDENEAVVIVFYRGFF